MAAMDFKLYGTPDTAQQLLRMVGMSDGVASLLNGAPAPLKEIGGRLLDRVLPNGNGHGNGNGQSSPAIPSISIEAAQPLIAEGSRLVAALLPAEELGQLTVAAALDRALAAASDGERPTLLKLQGMVLLLPNVAAQPALSMLGAASTPAAPDTNA
jgi:hypothetical protein